MRDKDRLEQMLCSIKKESEPSGGLNESISKDKSPRRAELKNVEDVRGVITITDDENRQLGFVNKVKANRLKGRKQLEAQEVIFDTQISRLKHQAEATKRQSKAYWDAKSVDFTEGLKTYAQANMHLLEDARRDNKSTAVIDAYLSADKKMQEVMLTDIPDSVKRELISKIVNIRDNSVERIEQDTLANRYDLGPGK